MPASVLTSLTFVPPWTASGFLLPANLPTFSRAIAANPRAAFREPYLTLTAEGYYWRALIRGWVTVQGFDVQMWAEGEAEMDWQGAMRTKRHPCGVQRNIYSMTDMTEWDIPAKARRMCVEG